VCLKTAGGVVSITVRRLKSVSSSAYSGRRPSDDGSRNNDLHSASSKPDRTSKLSGLNTDIAAPDGEQALQFYHLKVQNMQNF